jgi:hypothetical protein
MKTETLTACFQFYNHYIDETHSASPENRPNDPTSFAHLMWMCDKAEFELVPQGQVDKAMRWLGFIQGVLCARGVFTLDELRAHSRGDAPPLA